MSSRRQGTDPPTRFAGYGGQEGSTTAAGGARRAPSGTAGTGLRLCRKISLSRALSLRSALRAACLATLGCRILCIRQRHSGLSLFSLSIKNLALRVPKFGTAKAEIRGRRSEGGLPSTGCRVPYRRLAVLQNLPVLGQQGGLCAYCVGYDNAIKWIARPFLQGCFHHQTVKWQCTYT